MLGCPRYPVRGFLVLKSNCVTQSTGTNYSLIQGPQRIPPRFTTISMTDGLPFNFLQPLTWFRHTNVAKLIYCLRANVYTALSRVRRNRDQRRQKAKKIQDKPPLYNGISPRPRARKVWISFPRTYQFCMETSSEAWSGASSVISTYRSAVLELAP